MKQLRVRARDQLLIRELTGVIARGQRLGFIQNKSCRQSGQCPPQPGQPGQRRRTLAGFAGLAATDLLLQENPIGQRHQVSVIGQHRRLDRTDLLNLPFDLAHTHLLPNLI